jgi:hypothetical protein
VSGEFNLEPELVSKQVHGCPGASDRRGNQRGEWVRAPLATEPNLTCRFSLSNLPAPEGVLPVHWGRLVCDLPDSVGNAG